MLKLFINLGAITHPLHMQPAINAKHRELFARVSQRLQTRDELDALNFEMFNNLVVETTRLGIEVKNLRMLVESLSTRLDFDERRARALEGVVQYRPGTPMAPPPPPPPRRPRGADDAERHAEALRPARRQSARRRGFRATAAGRGGVGGGAAVGAAASKAPCRARHGSVPAAGEPAGDDGLGDDGDDGGPESGEGAGYDDGPDDGSDVPTAPIAALPGVDASRKPAGSPDSSSPDASCGSAGRRRRRARSPSRRRRLGRAVKLAVVVQRYGADINGGAELHARYVAEMLARRHQVEVLTTCAHDYVTWQAHYPEGDGDRSTASRCDASRSRASATRRSSAERSIAGLRAAALDRRRDSRGSTAKARPARRSSTTSASTPTAFDFFLFFSYRYYHA